VCSEVPSDDHPVKEKIRQAYCLLSKYRDSLTTDPAIQKMVGDLQMKLNASQRVMRDFDIIGMCRQCEEEEGGSCCGKGIENRYGEAILLLNLLFGVTLPKKRRWHNSCYFLGGNGCTLKVRETLCVNYLCSKIRDKLKADELAKLQDITGQEMQTAFLLHEAIKMYMRNAAHVSSRMAQTMRAIATFFDRYKEGYEGYEGYRKTTDLSKLGHCVQILLEKNCLHKGKSVFMDLGCGDGRVNIYMSYFARVSIGVEIDPIILSEYELRKKELDNFIQASKLVVPPDNIYLVRGDSLKKEAHEEILNATGLTFKDVDLFYTYSALHDLFGETISKDAKEGAMYMVYGFNKILPVYDGLKLVDKDLGGQGIVALYKKL